MSIFSVEGSAVIVTGASSGLGERFARVLHAHGAHVLAVARRADRLEALAADCPGLVPLVADLSDDDQRATVVPAALDAFGRIDVLVNNAGLGAVGNALDGDLETFRYVHEVNLVAVFDLARQAARSMVAARKGSIINIASMFGLVSGHPVPTAPYASSKGAVINLTRELACQWARYEVRVNALAPGFFPTESTAGMEESEASRRYIEVGTPMRRMGRPDELDGALLYLASDASSFMTGHALVVDGGWTAH